VLPSLSQGLEFTLSPRMAHFECVVTETQRAIADYGTRSPNRFATATSVSMCCAGKASVLKPRPSSRSEPRRSSTAMSDAGLKPGSAVQLADPLEALRIVTGDPTCRKKLRMTGGEERTAIGIQRHYLEMAEAHAGHACMPAWTSDVCRRWRSVLDLLEGAPDSVSQTLDWGIKWALYKNHARNLGIRWDVLPILNQAAALLATQVLPIPLTLPRACRLSGRPDGQLDPG